MQIVGICLPFCFFCFFTFAEFLLDFIYIFHSLKKTLNGKQGKHAKLMLEKKKFSIRIFLLVVKFPFSYFVFYKIQK